jgi:L-2-amino-thiazoline-4-carboxylic acid hydrolase-like protein
VQDPANAPGGYTPDPVAETAMVVDAFCAALAKRFPQETGLVDRLARRRQRLAAEQQHRVVDEPSRYNLEMTLAVLAAYDELGSGHHDDELIPALRQAFVEPLEPFVRHATRSVLDEATDPFAAIVLLTKDREQQAFGTGFVFTHPEDDDDQYTAQVERCYYHDVLKANGAEQLTPIFCAFDSNWIDAIDTDCDEFQFERPTTIGTGGPNCPFRFRRHPRRARL